MGRERKRGIMINVLENIIAFVKNRRQRTLSRRWFMMVLWVTVSMGFTGNVCPADIIDFQSFSWDSAQQHIYRNSAPIVEPATDTIPGVANGEDFYYVQSSYDVYNDVSFSGAGAGNPQIFSHVYNFTNPYHSTFYTSQNTTGHSRTYNYSSADIGHPNVRRFTFQDSLTLNGSLILAYTDSYDDYEGYSDFGRENGNNLEGLSATFNVLVTKEILKKNGKIKSRKLLKGSISLFGREDGSYKIKTKGKIKKKHISQIIINNGLIYVELDDEVLYYSTRARVNQNFSIITSVTSTACNIGDGSGSEVIFGPGNPNIPVLFATGEIPEPATILLLTTGALLGLRRRKR